MKMTKIGGPQSSETAGIPVEELQKEITFPEFTRADAMKLAKIAMQKNDMVKEQFGISFAVMIKLYGQVVFQCFPEGTGEFNQAWMEKKIRTVEMMHVSTMALWAGMESVGRKRVPETLPLSDIVLCGGGYPIKLDNGEVVGVFAASGPGDQNDHYFAVECLEELKNGTGI